MTQETPHASQGEVREEFSGTIVTEESIKEMFEILKNCSTGGYMIFAPLPDKLPLFD